MREEVVILLAEDDEGHAGLIRKNLARAGIVKQFKAILSNKVYNTAETATVLVPDSHHENVRGQAYYQ